MAVAFGTIGTSNVTTTKSLSLTLVKPTSVAVGDLMVMVVGNCAPARWTLPSGWTAIDDATVGDCGGAVYIKFAVSADVSASNYAVSYTTNGGAAFAAWGVIIRYTGVAAVKAVGSSYLATAGTTSGALPTPTGAAGTDLVVGVYNYGADATGTGRTLTYPTTGTWTQRVKLGPSAIASTYNGGAMVVEKFGATDAPTATAGSIGMWLQTVLVLSPTAPTNPSPRRNECPNPALAVDATGFSAVGTNSSGARVTGLSGFQNPNGYRLTVASTPTATLSMFMPTAPAVPGDVWSASCEVASNSATGNRPVIYFDFINSSGTTLGTLNPSTKLLTTTTPQTVLFYGFAAPANTASMSLELFLTTYDAVLNDFYTVTSVQYEKIWRAQPYFDGNSSGWAWDGTAGKSASGQYSGPPPGNWFLAMNYHEMLGTDPELDAHIITPKQRLLIPGRRNPRRRRIFDLAARRRRILSPSR